MMIQVFLKPKFNDLTKLQINKINSRVSITSVLPMGNVVGQMQ
jgi:hypothetical protein